MRNCNMTLIERLQKYQLYHLAKLIRMNILLVKKYCHQQQMIEQTIFTYTPLGKTFGKQTKTIKYQREKQADAFKALKPKETKPMEYDNYFINRLAEILPKQLTLII